MNFEKSCGFVAYKEIRKTPYYLIIRTSNGEYGFPKGHMETDETEYETAVRELKEETNVEVERIDGFRCQIEYKLPKKANTMKQSVYFLGKCIGEDLVCQETEVSEARFVPLEEAMKLLTFENTKQILKEADAYIRSADSL